MDKKELSIEAKNIREFNPNTNDGNQKIMKFRRLLADEISTSSIQINSDKEYSEVFELLVQKRNQVIVRKIASELKKPSIIGMVFGSEHRPDFLSKFNQGWGFKAINQCWIPAWSLE